MNTYDYIVVGGGSAGATIAARLSEDANTSVLLLEAGQAWHSIEAPSEMRGYNFFKILMRGGYDWTDLQGTLTTAKPPEHYFVGKGLGGGSAINGEIWMRPPLEDFDQWATLGCTGWSGEEVLPYFCKSETDELDRSYHGNNGPVPVWRPKEPGWGAVDRALYQTALQFGHPQSIDLDLNAPGATGLSLISFNLRDHQRVTTNDAYLEPARLRSNLTILGHTLVDQVLFSGTQAVGVRAIVAGHFQDYYGKQIVLCAGAIFTPTILMRSGIGAAEKLCALGKTVISDRPGVGQNLADHPMLSVTFGLKEAFQMPNSDSLLSSFYLQWQSQTADSQPNDLVIFSMNLVGATPEAVNTGGLVIDLFHIYSRGQVDVQSLDPMRMPRVEVGMLSDPRDRLRLRQGVRHLFEIVTAQPFTDLMESPPLFSPRGLPGLPLGEFADDRVLEQAMLEYCAQFFHPTSTCKMGALSDPMAVVDPNCRVIGVKNLYVADASIMPNIVRANTNATAVMIGEMMADKLKDNTAAPSITPAIAAV